MFKLHAFIFKLHGQNMWTPKLSRVWDRRALNLAGV